MRNRVKDLSSFEKNEIAQKRFPSSQPISQDKEENMKRCLVVFTLIVGLCLPLSHASAAVMTGLGLGSDAQNTFAGWVSTFGGTYIDFEDLSQGTHLTSHYSRLGVNFESTIDYYGSPISNYVYVYTSISKEIMGSPYPGAGRDGRVVYEVQFDSPQKWAGLTRHWHNTSTITNFYNETGGLIDTVQGYGDDTWVPIFAGYLAETDDPTQWVKTIECTGIGLPSARQVGYTDNVYFGTSAVPIPGAVWLLGSGLVGFVGLRKKFKK